MSNDSPVLTSLTENSTDVPVSVGQVDSYVLLLVVLSVFAGGTLVLLSLLVLFCHRCCLGGRRYSRASDDPEKTNTTYAEDSQPTQEITIRLDESDALSASSCHDGDSERFVSTGIIGRRVSFNESALYEQEKTAQDRGRRYTLTEGDFHHLKKARLTHLHLPPAPCNLKILTIMECDSTESSTVNINETPASKVPLSIYQLSERKILGDPLEWVGGLPGDPHHSVIMDQSRQSSLVRRPPHTRSQTMETFGNRPEAECKMGLDSDSNQALGQTSVLRFFSKLRRHASLEGVGPYFRRWKFDSSHRAASLDDKGSPKRRPFQRQRAASETTDHTEEDSSLRDNTIESIPQSPIDSSGLQSLSAECLSHPATAPAPSVFFRLKLEAMMEVENNNSRERPFYDALGQETATAKEENKLEKVISTNPGGARHSSIEEDDLFVQESPPKEADQQEKQNHIETEIVDGDDVVLGAMARQRANSGSSISFTRQESTEAPPSLYRDIWSLRASLEQYASSDQSSTDRESIRSDADSVSSFGGAGARSGLNTCLSQDLDDEPEGESEGEVGDRGLRGPSGNDDAGNGAVGDGESGNRKLLQMDSGYASIEAPSRAPEDMRLFGTSGASRGKTASERRLFFTNSGRKGSVCESVEAKLLQEELEDDLVDSNDKLHNSTTQLVTVQEPCIKPTPSQPHESTSHLMSTVMKPQPPSPHKPRLRRRDYSIDEKTDALFTEFLRHDPRFDQPDSPLRARRRSRVHLRKQWQRHKQYSDPGSSAGGRYSPSLDRQRFTPLRRGDSAGYLLDTRYHSTLSRIASAADEEASEVASSEAETKQSNEEIKPVEAESTKEVETSVKEEMRCEADADCVSKNKHTGSTTNTNMATEQSSQINPRVNNRNNNSSQVMLSESSLADKLVMSVEERLYGGLRSGDREKQGETKGNVTTVTASPEFKPK
ncbi:voltage-dependent calcium channel beta subunit-associated regulatory protein [Boleophthalmus pectinirostris]|uniref:voltage-dependent calcium channel beta subunit-associated regulatory protein n=1 Tax=Boleophthalmus pectinirostris TaxID=150288 RepID=UPI000A1C7070|nr:voltage-dependent calcium channel beta subunit-associated regulatory protein [Boleophthalmus pectinirostris]